MPKLGRTARAKNRNLDVGLPSSFVTQNHSMSYYQHGRVPSLSGSSYYDPAGAASAAASSMAAAAAAAAQQPIYQESFAVGPLTMPPTTMPIGAVAGGSSSLPMQHPRTSSGAWSPHDDEMLIQARACGENWALIQTRFPGKTPNACRKRHERLMERRNADDFDARRMETIAREYVKLRREIWTPLAQHTGEKWSVVEQRCMAHGLKNLQGLARAASRRDRLESEGHYGAVVHFDDEESGDSGGGLSPGDDGEGISSSPCGSINGGRSIGGSSSHSSSGSSTSHHQRAHSGHVAGNMGPPLSHAGQQQQKQQQQSSHYHHQAHLQPQSLSLPPVSGPTVQHVASNTYADYYTTAAGFSSSLRDLSVGGQQQVHAMDMNSPYMGHQPMSGSAGRMSAPDMGIESIINRGTSRGSLQ